MNNLHNHQQQENYKINRGSHKSTIPHEVNKQFKLHQFSLASVASIVENFLSSGRLLAFLATVALSLRAIIFMYPFAGT
ncbi:hypothetical protein AAJ76_1700054631 [Vairimorpha ceranae]|uniref:Uncharacterized protein n=1 Tax=Vairimorpha ceranae TaxID=40302 RepID=A0A0F9WFU3_9MICR|nr:hypothetical protein AAJ76_1700054631 [Vairimorpha ceranae]KKO75595.1 hypothetical protein AAJ76_1700054631 [Vairimorpha ceranae]